MANKVQLSFISARNERVQKLLDGEIKAEGVNVFGIEEQVVMTLLRFQWQKQGISIARRVAVKRSNE